MKTSEKTPQQLKIDSIHNLYVKASSIDNHSKSLGLLDEIIQEYSNTDSTVKDLMINHYKIEKAKTYSKMKNLSSALEILNELKEGNRYGSDSYLRTVEFGLYFDALNNSEDIDEKLTFAKDAMSVIKEAKKLNDRERIEFFSENQGNNNSEANKAAMNNYDYMERQIAEKELDIKMTINSIESKVELKKMAERYEENKIRQFEQLGLFAAVIALVIANTGLVFNANNPVSLEKIFYYNISFIVSLALLLALGSFYLDIGKKEGDMKRFLLIIFVGLFLLSIVLIKPF